MGTSISIIQLKKKRISQNVKDVTNISFSILTKYNIRLFVSNYTVSYDSGCCRPYLLRYSIGYVVLQLAISHDETNAMTDGRKCLFIHIVNFIRYKPFKIIHAQSGILVFHRIITAAVPSHLLYCQRQRLSSAILRYIFTLFIFKQLKGGTLLF
jgi:hypothetical protein